MTPLDVMVWLIVTIPAFVLTARMSSRRGRPAVRWLLVVLFGWIGFAFACLIPATREAEVQAAARRLAVEQEARRRVASG